MSSGLGTAQPVASQTSCAANIASLITAIAASSSSLLIVVVAVVFMVVAPVVVVRPVCWRATSVAHIAMLCTSFLKFLFGQVCVR